MSDSSETPTIKNRFLSLCRNLESFRPGEAIDAWRDEFGDEGSESYLRSLISDDPRIVSLSGEDYVSIPARFEGAEFRIFPIGPELEQQFLLLGHRVLPFVSRKRSANDITLVDVDGNKLSRSVRKMEWDTVKRFNALAPPEYQVETEENAIADVRDRLLEQQKSTNDDATFPGLGGPSRPDYDTIRYRMDLELSENALPVRVYDAPELSPDTKSLLARVEDYESGIISVRSSHVDELKKQRDAEQFSTKVVETINEQHRYDSNVEPLIQKTLLRNPSLMNAPNAHWVQSVLDSDQLRVVGIGVDPIIEPEDAPSENSRKQMRKNFGMKMMYGHLLDQYRDQPEELVQNALDAWRRRAEDMPGYFWAIQKLGDACQEPLMKQLRESDDETMGFFQTALQQCWTDSLGKSLRMIAQDDRVSDPGRLVAVSLLIDHGTDSDREFATKLLRTSNLGEEFGINVELEDLEPEEFAVHNKKTRLDLLNAPVDETRELLQRMDLFSSPAAFFPGTALVYARNKEKRELGADLIVQSSHYGSGRFINDLSNLPLAGLQRLSNRPVPVKNEGKTSLGIITDLLRTSPESEDETVAAGLANFGDWNHGFLVIFGPDDGVIHAEFECIPNPVEDAEELVGMLVPDLASFEFERIDQEELRAELISAEHRTLSGASSLPDAYKFAKPLLYLPTSDD